MANIKELINQGVKYEDEFVELYYKVIKDEGFLQFFPDQDKAKMLLQTLIDESKAHKAMLETILTSL